MTAPETDKTAETKSAESKREPTVTRHALETVRGTLTYTARAAWTTLRENEKPVAEMFHTAYSLDGADPHTRPITFVFNGGPGASSAYLHVGCFGPRRVDFTATGATPPPPAHLVDNQETWLHFTDLVFVDPIGTGFSRAIVGDDKKSEKGSEADAKKADESKRKAFWSVKRDLDALCEFIRGYLTANQRWASPVFIAGESYGGFRVARLARQLQEMYGVGLNGAILVSPAIEFKLSGGNDYDALFWIDVFPSMALAARHHGLCRVEAESDEALADAAETFAREILLPALALGAAMTPDRRKAVYSKQAAFIGLSEEFVTLNEGRIFHYQFARELLRSKRRFAGLYDASVAAIDAFPDRDSNEAPDPTLFGTGRVFTRGVHMQLRSLGIEEEARTYNLLNFKVFENWRLENEGTLHQGYLGSMDALRFGMALNPEMRVFITHGFYDLVTPYFTSNRLVDTMRLDEELAPRLTLEHYKGGHMFYTWEESRERFFASAQNFYNEACP